MVLPLDLTILYCRLLFSSPSPHSCDSVLSRVQALQAATGAVLVWACALTEIGAIARTVSRAQAHALNLPKGELSRGGEYVTSMTM